MATLPPLIVTGVRLGTLALSFGFPKPRALVAPPPPRAPPTRRSPTTNDGLPTLTPWRPPKRDPQAQRVKATDRFRTGKIVIPRDFATDPALQSRSSVSYSLSPEVISQLAPLTVVGRNLPRAGVRRAGGAALRTQNFAQTFSQPLGLYGNPNVNPTDILPRPKSRPKTQTAPEKQRTLTRSRKPGLKSRQAVSVLEDLLEERALSRVPRQPKKKTKEEDCPVERGKAPCPPRGYKYTCVKRRKVKCR